MDFICDGDDDYDISPDDIYLKPTHSVQNSCCCYALESSKYFVIYCLITLILNIAQMYLILQCL